MLSWGWTVVGERGRKLYLNNNKIKKEKKREFPNYLLKLCAPRGLTLSSVIHGVALGIKPLMTTKKEVP